MVRPDAPAGRVTLAAENQIATITIDNPSKHNAMSPGMWRQLQQILTQDLPAGDVRCVILTGAGDAAFCSGADIAGFDAAPERPDNAEFDSLSDSAMDALRKLECPVIAAISGFCMGGGMALAAACDLRVATTTSRFAIPAARLGIGYGLENIRRLCGLMGPAAAKHLLFTADRLSAAEARVAGFLDDLCDPGDLQATVLAMAGKMSANAPLSIRAAKAAIDAVSFGSDPQAEAEAAALIARCAGSRDFEEGRRAFREKRPPVFTGR